MHGTKCPFQVWLQVSRLLNSVTIAHCTTSRGLANGSELKTTEKICAGFLQKNTNVTFR